MRNISPMTWMVLGWAGPVCLVRTGVRSLVNPVHLYVGAVAKVTSQDRDVGTSGLGGSILASPYLQLLALSLTARMLALTQVKVLKRRMVSMVNNIEGMFWNSTASSPSCSVCSQVSALRASSAVMILTMK